MKLDYDPAKRAWTLQHRKLDFEDAGYVWAGPHFNFEDARHDYGEVRICTVGFLQKRMVMVVWVDCGDRRRIISMRKCNEREQEKYGLLLRLRLRLRLRRDRDGWLVDAKTGALIGPDPQIERELTDEELARVRMGRPPLPENQRRTQVTMRWARETIEDLKALGPGWTNFAEHAVKRALANQRRATPKKRRPKP